MEKRTFKDKCKCAFDKVNIIKKLCVHLLGSKQTIGHRMLVGSVIMGVGYFLVEVTLTPHFIQHITNFVGVGIHAVGATPFIEWMGGLSVDGEEIIEAAEDIES